MEPQASSSPPLETDLYCMRCGYNLRGLSGDPIRCPECGKANEIETVIETAPLVGAHIARVESALLSMLLAMLIVVPLTLLGMTTGRGGRGPWWMLLCAAIAPVYWYFSMRNYASLTRGIATARSAAVAYLLGALVLVLVVGCGLLWPLAYYDNWYLDATRIRIAMICSGALLVFGMFAGVPRYESWIRTKLSPLKREVAVRIVADFLRSRDRAKYVRETQKFRAISDDGGAQGLS